MTTRALVTGGTGFVAQWALQAMLARGWNCSAAGLGALPDDRILSPEEHEQITWLELDVTQQVQVARVVQDAQPDVVLHLAAVSHVPHAKSDPAYAYSVNALGTVRLLAELQQQRARGTEPAVLVVGSCEEYGEHPERDLPLRETAELRPQSSYAASKVAQEVAALQAHRCEGLRVICTRSFNHSGIGHGKNFLLPGMIARALALPPSRGALTIGRDDIVRDFLHVSDVVAAYLALLDTGVAGEVYNVCSGRGLTVRGLAETVLHHIGRRADIVVDRTRVRAGDVRALIGDNSKLREATGWTAMKTPDDIIHDLIDAATH